MREPLVEAAFAGERQVVRRRFQAPDPRQLGGPGRTISRGRIRSGQVRGLIILVQDVTEQRAAERALRESEERFRRIADQAPTLMWVTRLDRTRDFVNDAYMQFVGGDREEACTLDWRERIHPDDHDRIVAESIAGEAARETFTLEGRYLNGAGEYRWLKSTSSPRFGPDGDLARLHRNGDGHHRGEGGAARSQAAGRGAHRRARPPRSPVPRRVRGGARSHGPPRTRRHRAGGEQQARDLASPQPGRGDREEAVGRADTEELSAAHRHHEAGHRARREGPYLHDRSAHGARGNAHRDPRRFGAAGEGAGRQDRLSALRGARHHRAEGRAGAAPSEPEDGSAGPADGRYCARLQQSADSRGRRARPAQQADRGRKAAALCRQCADRGGARARG